MSIRILVVDDHDVVRQGVRLILRRQSDWQICGEAENGKEALEREAELKPDLMILDISMPLKDGLEVATELKKRKSPTKVLVLTMHETKDLITALKAVGVNGYVVKSHAARDLVAAIQSIVGGGDFFKSTTPAAEQPEKPKKKLPMFRLTQSPAFA